MCYFFEIIGLITFQVNIFCVLLQIKNQKDKTPSIEIVSPSNTSLHEASEIVKAIAPFKATSVNQLSLETGDYIKVRSKSPAGWWEGELQRKNGSDAAETKV